MTKNPNLYIELHDYKIYKFYHTYQENHLEE